MVDPKRLLALYILAGLVTTATWTQFDAIGLVALLPIAIVWAIERWPSAWHQSLAGSTWWSEVRRSVFPGRPDRRSVLLGVIVCLPLLIHLGATLGEEFPFGGDEGYHFSASRTFARHLAEAGPWLVALAVAVAVVSRVQRRYLITLAVAALWPISLRFPPEVTFARYPAAFYFLAAPFNVFGEIARVPSPHVANHMVNTLSVPAWLFVLRPIVVRRWPDLPALVAGSILFFQPTVITHFGSGGIEPWSVVLLLVAFEAAFELPPADRWIAVLVAGCASWVKEPAILLLPVVWTMAMVGWQGGHPRLRPGAIPLVIAAGTPFIMYYFVRHTRAVHRVYEMAPLADIMSSSRAVEWIENVRVQVGGTGLILLGALAAFAVVGAAAYRGRAEDVRAHVLMMCGAAALVVFFYIDLLGVPVTGYGRYLMFPYALGAAAALLAARRFVERGSTRIVVGAAVFVLACQTLPLARTLALDFLPDYARNSLEWHRGLIRLPFRQLVRQIPVQPGGDAVTRIRLVTIALDAQSTRVAYPDVARRYAIVAAEAPRDTDCRCVDLDEAVIAGFEYRTNFDGGTPGDPAVASAEHACVAEIEASCRHVVFERDRSGTVVGALGVGVR